MKQDAHFQANVGPPRDVNEGTILIICIKRDEEMAEKLRKRLSKDKDFVNLKVTAIDGSDTPGEISRDFDSPPKTIGVIIIEPRPPYANPCGTVKRSRAKPTEDIQRQMQQFAFVIGAIQSKNRDILPIRWWKAADSKTSADDWPFIGIHQVTYLYKSPLQIEEAGRPIDDHEFTQLSLRVISLATGLWAKAASAKIDISKWSGIRFREVTLRIPNCPKYCEKLHDLPWRFGCLFIRFGSEQKLRDSPPPESVPLLEFIFDKNFEPTPVTPVKKGEDLVLRVTLPVLRPYGSKFKFFVDVSEPSLQSRTVSGEHDDETFSQRVAKTISWLEASKLVDVQQSDSGNQRQRIYFLIPPGDNEIEVVLAMNDALKDNFISG